MTVGGKAVTDLITTQTEQTLGGHIQVHESLFAFGDNLNVNHLISDQLVFGANLSALIADAVYRKDRLHIHGHKHFHNITADRIIFEKSDFWGVGNTKRVKELLIEGKKEMIITESTEFHRDFRIDHLVFNGHLNGIPSNEFGRQWLLYESDQVFTAPANISQIVLEDKLELNGKLNGIDMDDLVRSTLMKDSTETVIVKNIMFGM